ncbi:uncharacterized protein PAC_09852 [Phialocephala subalpina]|uniref:2EXR domain-containing protein n=1 Tax=Phialocephala subalpina TaxID=576137 RepID=A0A1L7X4N4_9HELO|nr:uncharacterized protein PAC_09852 [Phialocephala subalpina]
MDPAPVRAPKQFSDLPQEIRDEIWKAAVNNIGPRVIALQQSHWWNKTARIPALLHACRDSRAVALKRYKLITTEKELEKQPEDQERVVDMRNFLRDESPAANLNCYVDYDKDIFMISDARVSHHSPDIAIHQPTFQRLLRPAKRLLTINSLFSGYCPHRNHSCEYSNFWAETREYTEGGNSKEVFAIQIHKKREVSARDELSEFILLEDFVGAMNRHRKGWTRKCKAVSFLDWHKKDDKCFDSCKQEFSDNYPAIQVLDFKKYQDSRLL